jgi:hypothetical protein
MANLKNYYPQTYTTGGIDMILNAIIDISTSEDKLNSLIYRNKILISKYLKVNPRKTVLTPL